MDDLIISPAAAPTETPSEIPPPRRSSAWKWILVLLVLAAAALAFWWTSHTAKSGGETAAQQPAPTDTQVESLMHSVTQLRSATETLRSRIDDGDKVDTSVREQLLGLSERTRLLEDAVANLSNK